YHLGKQPLPGHDAVPHAPVDLTVAMALFSDLSQLQDNLTAHHKASSHRKRPQVHLFYNEVFPEGSRIYLRSPPAEILDLFKREKANLAVPVSCVGISLNSPVLSEDRLSHRSFDRPPLFTDTYLQKSAQLLILRSCSYSSALFPLPRPGQTGGRPASPRPSAGSPIGSPGQTPPAAGAAADLSLPRTEDRALKT